jgi:allophanate hydrolase subunit 2
VLRVVPGPRADRFAAGALERLCGQAWSVSADANRIGVRLRGVPLERLGDEELPSEGLVAGSLEVPPAGNPILLLTDHPTTGGYPVIAVVTSADLPHAGQLVPGGTVRFRAA